MYIFVIIIKRLLFWESGDPHVESCLQAWVIFHAYNVTSADIFAYNAPLELIAGIYARHGCNEAVHDVGRAKRYHADDGANRSELIVIYSFQS